MTGTEKSTPASAIVLGGGIIGLACALELQRRGVVTKIIEREARPRGASWGNAGHIAVEQVEPLAAPGVLASLSHRLFSRGGSAAFPLRDIGAWLPFGLRLLRASSANRFAAGKAALKPLLANALPAWRRLVVATGTSDLLAEDGHFVVWESAATARIARERWSGTDIGTATFHDLSPQDVAMLSSVLGRAPVDGLRFAGTGRVRDPGELHLRLSQVFEQQGGEWQRERVVRLEPDRSRTRVHLDGGTVCEAGLVVVTAGVGSAELLRCVGHRAPLIAERGYHLQAGSAAWPDMPPVVFEDRSMIVSRFHSGLRAAGFVEFSRASSPPDPRKWRRLRAHTAALRIPFDTEPREWLGARPTLPDYLPAIGRSRRCGHLLYAFGHQHLGLTLAAITGELVGALAANEPPSVDCGPFDVERFGGAGIRRP